MRATDLVQIKSAYQQYKSVIASTDVYATT